MAMQKAPFNGNLNPNEIFSAIYNMVISQQVMVPELADNYGGLLDQCKVDGTLYGDTKLFYSSDVYKSRPWTGDSEASNLLSLNRPAAPYCQAITLDQFRQIDITVDNYLSKRAWGTEGVFTTFNGVVLGMISKTKRLYEVTMFNAYVGTCEGGATRNEEDIILTGTGDAQAIATAIADLMTEMGDYSRDFNDHKYMRAYGDGEIKFVVNAKWLNKIKKTDLPTIFHNDGLLEKLTENKLPARYFGNIAVATDIGETGVIPSGVVDEDDAIVRSLVEKDYTVGGVTYHCFPGDQLVDGATVGANAAANKNFIIGEVYIEDGDIIAKAFSKDTFKIMSAFEVGTNFFNPRSLTENHYLTWGFSKPDRLKDQPLVTIRKAASVS